MGNAQEFTRFPSFQSLCKLLPYAVLSSSILTPPTNQAISDRSSDEDITSKPPNMNGMSSCTSLTASSRRWKPTVEQLAILEEVYNSGIQSPSSDQIDQITLHLRAYGEIQGKNVFYWFQNHKWSDRQKRRKATDQAAEPLTIKMSSPSPNDIITSQKESAGMEKQWAVEEIQESEFSRKRLKLGQIGQIRLDVSNDENMEGRCHEIIVPNNRHEAAALQTLQLFPLHPTYGDRDNECKKCASTI